jgi:tetratricopeptide (TPR) repeat protein
MFISVKYAHHAGRGHPKWSVFPANAYFQTMTIDAAIDARNHGEYRQARQILEELLLFEPESALVHYHLAVTHGMQGEDRPAIFHYRAALDTGLPEVEEGQAALAMSATLRSQGRYLEAARFLREILTRRPQDDGLRAFLALTLHKLGMHAEAVTILIRLLVTTSSSSHIRTVAPILSFYADSLDQRTEEQSA